MPFSSLTLYYPQLLSVQRRESCGNGIRIGVRYQRKAISGGGGISMQSGWMLWAIGGWVGFFQLAEARMMA